MRKKGAKGAPTDANFRRAAKTAKKKKRKSYAHGGMVCSKCNFEKQYD